jgi:hemoglobin-like flavoprotein
MYHHIPEVTADFFCEDLIEYMEKMLGLDKLAAQLRDLARHHAQAEELAAAIMSAANYYDQKEVDVVRKEIKELAGLSEAERMKWIGDQFLRQRQYQKALKQYQKVERLFSETEQAKTFWAALFHHCSEVCLHMFYWGEAEEYAMRAYRFVQDQAYLKEAAFACYLSGKPMPQEVPFATGKSWEQEWGERRQEIGKTQAYQRVSLAQQSLDEGNMVEYREQVARLLDDWKQEYRTQFG